MAWSARRPQPRPVRIEIDYTRCLAKGSSTKRPTRSELLKPPADRGKVTYAVMFDRAGRIREQTIGPLERDWIVSHLPTDQIGRATSLAIEVFDDEEVAVAWLREPNLATDNKAPIALLGTTEGYERVRNLLLRI